MNEVGTYAIIPFGIGGIGLARSSQARSRNAGRFRSLGDGQVDFASIFSKLIQYGYDSWAVMEWECCIKSPEQGAAEGAPFIASHMIDVTEVAFDDFAGGTRDEAQIKRMLGL